MSRIKPIFAVLMLTAIMGIGPMAKAATTVQATIAGASAMWQTVALAAYQEAGAGAGHWTSASNVISLTDSRVTPANDGRGYHLDRMEFHRHQGVVLTLRSTP